MSSDLPVAITKHKGLKLVWETTENAAIICVFTKPPVAKTNSLLASLCMSGTLHIDTSYRQTGSHRCSNLSLSKGRSSIDTDYWDMEVILMDGCIVSSTMCFFWMQCRLYGAAACTERVNGLNLTVINFTMNISTSDTEEDE